MTAQTVQRNPYIVGRPITEPELFFGRQSLFQFIEDNLNQGATVILLHGQRRIGKSSVLNQIPNFVGLDKFEFVLFDLHDRGRAPLGEVLYSLAIEIIDSLDISEDRIELPSVQELQTNPSLFDLNFLSEVYQVLCDKNLVLLLDEFDVLSSYEPESAAEKFFLYLQSILKKQEKLFIIPVVGRHPDDMPKLLSLFKGTPNQRISLLDKLSAEQLIEKPAKGDLEYDPDAILAILDLSAGHPYFTQIICHALFAQARSEQNWKVTRNSVEKIADKAIEIGEAGLVWFRDGLPIPERVFFSAAAEVQRIQIESGFTLIEPLALLEKHGVFLTDSLQKAADYLVEWGFFKEVKSSELSTVKAPIYKVTIELVRRWLLRRYSLQREIWELENLDSKATRTYELARELLRQNAPSEAIEKYQETLEINPNHFSALFEMAEACLKAEKFESAAELYTRAYKVNPLRTKEGFVQASLGYGQVLVQLGKKVDDFGRAIELYAQAYQIDPIRTNGT